MLLPFAGTISVSCTDDIPECPSRMCVIAGGWKLTEVIVDNTPYDGDLRSYRLTLSMPSPADAPTSFFNRVSTSGALDEGSWSLENNKQILRLMPGNDPSLTENWIIKSMTPRKMILILNRDVDIKKGPAKIEFILEPF
jgi:hypothetical protein